MARLHLSDAEAEQLTVWIAHRVGRAQALAGDRVAFGRLEHVVRHWLSEGERSALLCWLLRRIGLGQPPVRKFSRVRPGEAPGGLARIPGAALGRPMLCKAWSGPWAESTDSPCRPWTMSSSSGSLAWPQMRWP